MSITFDSWAWIEYFAGTKLGTRVKEYINDDIQIYTPSVCLMEIKAKWIHEGKQFEDFIKYIEERSAIIDIDKEIALLAATIKSSEGMPSIDALIYATARILKIDILTGDSHFKDKKGVEFLS